MMTVKTPPMPGPLSKLCSPVMQLSWVRHDAHVAMRYWIEVMGVGPFWYFTKPNLSNHKFEGKPVVVTTTAAIAYWGDIQIEIISQLDDGPSVYRNAPYATQDMHHICVTTERMDDVIAEVEKSGGKVAMSFDEGDTGKVIYADMGKGGPLVEVIHLTDANYVFFDMMRDVAKTWDGSDPIREY